MTLKAIKQVLVHTKNNHLCHIKSLYYDLFIPSKQISMSAHWAIVWMGPVRMARATLDAVAPRVTSWSVMHA